MVKASDSVGETIDGGWLYRVAAPIGQSGMAVLGDTGHFVTLGRKRIKALSDDGTVSLTIAFAAGESARIIEGYSPDAPAAVATAGAIGPLSYDSATKRFSVAATPGADGTASLRISRPAANSPASGAGTRAPTGLDPAVP